MYKIKALDPLDEQLKERMEKQGLQVNETADSDAIFVRSRIVDNGHITPALLAITRGGVGVNTIDVKACTENGTAVFNTPGVNANAVKELILTSLLLSARPVCQAMEAVQKLAGENILQQAEQTRYTFIGEEIFGKTIGILGLGTIGKQVAETCYHLGMNVLGYDRLKQKNSVYFRQVNQLPELLSAADYVVLSLPLTSATANMINREELEYLKEAAVLLNFGRGELVNNDALLKHLKRHPHQRYISDFPSKELLHHNQISLLPHIGGSTDKALEDGTILALRNLRAYLLYGTVESSVNFPNIHLQFQAPLRLALYYRNQAHIFSQITNIIDEENIEIDIIASERRGEHVYTLIDLEETDHEKGETIADFLDKIEGVIRVRLLVNPDRRETSHDFMQDKEIEKIF